MCSVIGVGMKHNHFITLAVLSCCAVASTQLSAQEKEIEEIVVNAHPLGGDKAAFSFITLDEDELVKEAKSSIGETLENQAGLRSASFGPAVGRPVIRGLGAARVKVTEDKIDTLDVSVTSADHAVTVEPFIANQVTILKGASSLIYGSGAIGGVVDVDTGRIPSTLTGEAVSGRVELRGADNEDAFTGAFRLDGEVGQGFAWHVDGFTRDSDDYEIPGFVESSQLRELEEAEALAAGEAEEEGEEERGTLEGSFQDVQGGSVGFSFIGERGFVGLAVSRTEGEYGLVGAHEEEEGEEEGEEEEEGTAELSLEQTRVDLEGELRFENNFIEKVNLRLGVNDYEHVETEPSGDEGTVFDNDAWEARLQVSHAPILGFSGVFGLQLNDREFSAIGEEAFVEPVDSDSQAIFWVAERDFNQWHVEGGLRFEQTDYEPTGQDENGVAFEDEDFSTFSASLGGVYSATDELDVSVLLDYASRAPTIEELFSFGPHIATQTFEVGDPSLDEESVLSLSLGANYNDDITSVSVNLYFYEFDDFIYQEFRDSDADGEVDIEDGFPVLDYTQEDASFVGLDVQADIKLGQLAAGDLGLSLLFDVVDAEVDVDGNQNLPRIPSSRYGFGFNWATENWDIDIDYVRVEEQDDVADFELETSAYDDLGFRIARNFKFGDNGFSVFLSGENLTDDEQRNHVSFVKDFAPARGRTFEVGARLQF